MTLLIFLLILSFLVFIHELGHFVMARRAGVKVEEFGFGYPPKAITLFTDKKGTEYTFNWLPFGGFVRLHGEDGSVNTDESHAFYSKKKRKRLGIIVAGAIMNFVFGVVAFGAIYTKTGIPTNLEYVRIDEITEGSPAEQAGLVVGDRVVAVSHEGDKKEVKTNEDFILTLSGKRGAEVTLEVDGENENEQKIVYVRKEDEIPEGEGAIGVAITDFEMRHYPIWQMPFRGMWVGLQAAVAFGVFLLGAIVTMFKELIFSGIVPKDVAGPVGIVHMAQKEGLLTSGFVSILNFSAILSINLGVVNLLPIPALDGGRAVFVMLEGLVGKKALEKIEQKTNTVGFILLLAMIVAVSVRDVRILLGDVGAKEWFSNLF
ncbi:RIP metalloprotease [Patescibacteria group bacterium]